MVNRFLKTAGIGLLSLALSVVWLAQPASAQLDEATTRPVPEDYDDDFDWGWIGLFGLLGLGGLMRRDRHRDDHRDMRTTATGTTTAGTTTPRA